MNIVTERAWPLERVISGGQSGSDRAGLEIARALGIPTGGVAPHGYRTEYGPDLDLRDIFGLSESESATYDVRTLANVRGSDGTVIFARDGARTGGSGLTASYCRVVGKPHVINPTAGELVTWIDACQIGVLNTAGSRHSTDNGIYDHVVHVLIAALATVGQYVAMPQNPHAGRR